MSWEPCIVMGAAGGFKPGEPSISWIPVGLLRWLGHWKKLLDLLIAPFMELGIIAVVVIGWGASDPSFATAGSVLGD